MYEMYVYILKNISGKTKISVKNAKELKRNWKKLKIPKGYILVSPDVIPLFTKISKELVYESTQAK